MAQIGDQTDESDPYDPSLGGTYQDMVNNNVLQMGSQNPETPQAMGSVTPPPDPSTYAQTGFYTDSPGPGYDNYGRPTSTPAANPQNPSDVISHEVPAPSPTTPTYGAGAATQPTAAPSGGIPPELQSILDSLKAGLSNFQVPQINYQPQTTPAYDDLVRSAIMDAISSGQQPVDASDPMIAPMLAAVQGQAQRAKESNQSDLAERLSAQHLLSSGAYDTGTERYNQGIDEATGGTVAQLMTQALSQRQTKLMQAIQMGANYLNADQARQLQAELANVNSALGQYQAKSSVGLGTLASLLQNQQFYDQLGVNIGEFASNQNSNATNF